MKKLIFLIFPVFLLFFTMNSNAVHYSVKDFKTVKIEKKSVSNTSFDKIIYQKPFSKTDDGGLYFFLAGFVSILLGILLALLEVPFLGGVFLGAGLILFLISLLCKVNLE